MDDAAGYRAESRRGWGAVAEGWETHSEAVRRNFTGVAVWMLDAARLQPGARVLELAAGTAEVGLMAHELIQPGGELIVSDFAPEMLSAAQRAAGGLDGVRFKQIDMESIDIAAASQDAVLCRWGLMFLADPAAAAREVRRVLKPGGRFATACWTTPEENAWSSVVGEVLGEDEAEPGAPGQFALGAPGALRELLEGAGFVEEIEVEAMDLVIEETFEQWWTRTTGMSRSGPRIGEHREALRAALSRYEGEDGVLRLPGRTWMAAATA